MKQLKRKIRRLNLARSARAAMSASHPNVNEPKANLFDPAVSEWLSRLPSDHMMIMPARVKLQRWSIGDPVRFNAPFSGTVFTGVIESLDQESVTILWSDNGLGTFRGSFRIGQTWGLDCIY